MLKLLSKPKAGDKKIWRSIYDQAQRHGYELYKANLGWLTDPEFLKLKEEWGDIPGNSGDRSHFLFSTARNLKHVAGETADIGVRYGSSSFYLLKGFADSTRAHHIFDSFEGLSAPTESDRNASTNKIFWKQGDISVGEDVTRKCLSMFSNISYYKGWVPERFSEVADRTFALVHVDVDLYEPTRDSFEFFYPRMNKGGVMICDDYGFTTCPGAKKAVDEFFAGKETVFALPSGQALIIKS